MDDIFIVNLVLISGEDCPSNEYTIDKGPERPDLDCARFIMFVRTHITSLGRKNLICAFGP